MKLIITILALLFATTAYAADNISISVDDTKVVFVIETDRFVYDAFTDQLSVNGRICDKFDQAGVSFDNDSAEQQRHTYLCKYGKVLLALTKKNIEKEKE